MKLTGKELKELAIHMETHDIYYVYQNSVKTIVLTHKKGYEHTATINAIEFIKHYYNK